MQNDSISSRIIGSDQRVINYRTERAGYDVQRQNDVGSANTTYTAESSRLITPFKLLPFGATTPIGRAVTATGKKPFTLGHAIVSFVGIIAVLIMGYLAYTTWIAQ